MSSPMPLLKFVKARVDEDLVSVMASDVLDRRALGEIDAKKAIIKAYEPTLRLPGYHNDVVQHTISAHMRYYVIQPIAAIYSDHPEYRREWKS